MNTCVNTLFTAEILCHYLLYLKNISSNILFVYKYLPKYFFKHIVISLDYIFVEQKNTVYVCTIFFCYKCYTICNITYL